MEELFNKQIKLQIKLNNFPLNNKTRQEFITMQSIALIDEVMEALRETPWKPWKKSSSYNQELFKEELIDAWHFLINLSIASGMDWNEVKKRFLIKNVKNNKRQNNGY